MSHSGDTLKFENRHQPHRLINFGLKIFQKRQFSYFSSRNGGSLQFAVSAQSEGGFGKSAAQENFGFGLLYGLILVMAVFNFFPCITQGKAYGHYVGFWWFICGRSCRL